MNGLPTPADHMALHPVLRALRSGQIVTILLLFITTLYASSGEAAPPGIQYPPREFSLYSTNSSERITLSCTPVSPETIDGSLSLLQIAPPNIQEIETATQRGIEMAQQNPEWNADLFNRARVNILEMMKDPAIGPKRRQFLIDLESAYASKDPTKAYKTIAGFEKQVCKVTAQQYSLRFVKISPTRWESHPKPTGLCNVNRIYHLTERQESEWELVESTTDSDSESFCHELNKAIKGDQSWKTTNSYLHEPPCEFLEFRNVPIIDSPFLPQCTLGESRC
ncbi:MAG: hypothetical protein BVN29_17570 [Nitrospira sp. ST-bin5]|nr:MAG: hypothetical protein BVN29_17570 [Nitrospira sp. ST-bin5]